MAEVTIDRKTDFGTQEALIKNARNSYMTKEDFIEIITKLNFDRIETCHIHFITSYEYILETEKTRAYVKTYGYDINIS